MRVDWGGTEMSSQENVQLIRRFFAEIDRANVDALDQICADDYSVHFPGVPGPLDRAGTKYLFGAFLAAFPGLSHRGEETVAADGRIVSHWIEYDALGMLQQLGAMPAPGAAA